MAGVFTINEEERAVAPFEIPALLAVVGRNENGVGAEQSLFGNGGQENVLSVSVGSALRWPVSYSSSPSGRLTLW